EHALQDLQHLRQELESAREEIKDLKASGVPAHTLEHTLISAQRLASDIERTARDDASRLLAKSRSRARQMIEQAECCAGAVMTKIMEIAAMCDKQAAERWARLANARSAFEVAGDATATALREIAASPPSTSQIEVAYATPKTRRFSRRQTAA